MPNCPISFGNCSNSYLYILGAILFKFLENYLIKVQDIIKTQKNIFGIETIFRNHKLIIFLYNNLGYILFGLLFFFIAKQKEIVTQKKHKKKNIELSLIYQENVFTYHKLKQLLIVSFLFTIQILLRRILSFFSLGDFDLWIFNIIFILIYMNHYFVISLYRHQKLSLFFIFFTNLILLVWLTFLKTNDSINVNEQKINLYEYVDELLGSSGYSIIIYIIYLFFANILSLGRVLSKRLMEIEYETPYRIIFFIGIIGTLLSLITLIFTSIFECNESIKDFCKNNNHLDSIPQYFSELKEQIVEHTGIFFVEILIVFPLFLFFSFSQFVCEMLIIFHLNPNYILISDCIYFEIKHIFKKINGKVDTEFFIIQFIAEICALLGYIIFLEIIVLKFCKLDKDIKENIIKRGLRDSKSKEINLQTDSLVSKRSESNYSNNDSDYDCEDNNNN